MKRVLTLSADLFHKKCSELEAECACFIPDLVIGIPTGGRYVADNMFGTVAHTYIGAQRPTTHMKKGVIATLIARLPLRLADWLRIVEASVLQITRKRKRQPSIIITGDQASLIKRSQRILVVDDACDSGVTLAATLEAVGRYAGKHAEIRSAVITVTTTSPIVVPDFALFRNKTLVRFPWSADAKH